MSTLTSSPSSVSEAKQQVRVLGDAIRSLKPNQQIQRAAYVQQIQALTNKYIKTHLEQKKLTTQHAHAAAANGARCKFHVSSKNRYCKHFPIDGTLYCHMHTEFSEKKGMKRKRIPCPLNPKHSVYEHDVKQHVLICPDRPAPTDTSRAFYDPSVNRGPPVIVGIALLSSSSSAATTTTTTTTTTATTATISTSTSANSLSVNLRDPDAVRAFDVKVRRLLERARVFRGSLSLWS